MDGGDARSGDGDRPVIGGADTDRDRRDCTALRVCGVCEAVRPTGLVSSPARPDRRGTGGDRMPPTPDAILSRPGGRGIHREWHTMVPLRCVRSRTWVQVSGWSARGAVAVTATVGALTLRAGVTEPTGCVTALPVLRGPALPDVADLVFGGHDLVTIPVIKKAEALADSGVIPARLVVAVSDDLAEVEPWIRPVPVAARQADAPGRPAFDAAFARKDRGRRRAGHPAGGRPTARRRRQRTAVAFLTGGLSSPKSVTCSSP